MLRLLRWHLAKMNLSTLSVSYPPRHIKVRHKWHRDKIEHFPANADPYEPFASLYNEYARWFVPRYGPFLAAAGRYYGLTIRSVLDLACGTGLVSRQAAKRVESVVGLDISEAMLSEARSRTPSNNVSYVWGDYREFCLGETFDAAVCGTDALNYLGRIGELTDVFHCVGKHLRPGGLFAFDSWNHRFFEWIDGKKGMLTMNGERFEWYSFYDSDSRINEERVVLQGIVERHRRIPIEEEDVRRAANEAGLEVAERFSVKTYLFLFPILYTLYFYPVRQFYVLRKPSALPMKDSG
ncbi:MAG: class I SAM-dependent DNA methyltransferase [Gemmataceae bacterium]